MGGGEKEIFSQAHYTNNLSLSTTNDKDMCSRHVELLLNSTTDMKIKHFQNTNSGPCSELELTPLSPQMNNTSVKDFLWVLRVL